MQSKEETLSREKSSSTPSLHIDRELMKITETYVNLTRNLGRRSRSESVLSRSSNNQSNTLISAKNSSSIEEESFRGSIITTKEAPSTSSKKSIGKVLGKLGQSMVNITKRIGRSFSTSSLTEGKSEMTMQRSQSEQSLHEKGSNVEEKESNASLKESISSIKTKDSKSLKDSISSSKTKDSKSTHQNDDSLPNSKSLARISEGESTPQIGKSLQKITEDVILVTKCLLSPSKLQKSQNSSPLIVSEIDNESKISENVVEIDNESKLNENVVAEEENQSTDVGKREYHPFIKKILKKEESVEISKLLIEAQNVDEYRQKLIEEGMTFKHSLKAITNDIVTVTNLLGTDPNESLHEKVEKETDSSIDTDDLRTEVPTVSVIETPDIKEEIRHFTEDIIKITKLLTEVRKEEIIKIKPEVVYMKDGIDAMSCVTMESSPTRWIHNIFIYLINLQHSVY